MEQNGTYKWLGPKRGSRYRQFFVKDRGIRALALYLATQEPEARTPQEVADDWDVPLEVVHEAVEYCEKNKDILRLDWEMEEELAKKLGHDKPPPEALRARESAA
jgi:hypothetical protein